LYGSHPQRPPTTYYNPTVLSPPPFLQPPLPLTLQPQFYMTTTTTSPSQQQNTPLPTQKSQNWFIDSGE